MVPTVIARWRFLLVSATDSDTSVARRRSTWRPSRTDIVVRLIIGIPGRQLCSVVRDEMQDGLTRWPPIRGAAAGSFCLLNRGQA